MRVAAIQMNSGPDKSANLGIAHDLLREAVSKGAEWVCFPEYFALMSESRDQLLGESEPIDGVIVETLQEWAAEYDVWILGGGIPVRGSRSSKRGSARKGGRAPTPKSTPTKITNTSVLISDSGKLVARYDKIHLFDASPKGDRPFRESATFRAGAKPVLARVPFGKVGLSTCYDLRFPELYRRYSKSGAVALVAPSAFLKVTGQAHWDVLTRARAIENQCYLIAPAQTGAHPGKEGVRETFGHTRIVDPWGRIIAERAAGTGVVVAELDPERIEQAREWVPALSHRRLG